MNQEELQKNIALYYSKLPPKAQEVFSSMKWLEQIQTISEKHKLTEEEKQSLGTEITLLLLGMISQEEYEGNLKKELVSDPAMLPELLAEIEREVIADIKPEIQTAFETNTTPQTEEEKTREGELDARFAELPSEIQKAIQDLDYHSVLYSIAQKYGLTVSQIVDLEKITTDTMLGSLPTNEFMGKVIGTLSISEEKSRELGEEVKEKILKKIRQNLMAEYPEKKKDLSSLESHEENVLSSAGIKILDENKPVVKTAEPTKVLEPAPIIPKPTTPPAPHTFLEQKLNAPVQSQPIKTDHSEIAPKTEEKQATNPAYSKGKDPYRLPPI